MNKWVLRGGLIIIFLLIFSFVGGYFYLSTFKPNYNTEVSLNNLTDEVTVYYDEYAVPHIYGNNISDAYQALGYVHAKDRLWQMDLIRRIAPGRLSELFGSSTLETDKFFRTIGLNNSSVTAAREFEKRPDDDLKRLVHAYIEGVNKYIQEGDQTPEHLLLGLEMEPFTLVDVYNVIGYMSFSFSVAHRTEPIMDFIFHSFGEEYLNDLDIHVAPGTVTIDSDVNYDYSLLSKKVKNVIESLPAPELIGSNSWVIAPSKSASAGVLFANDPHIGFSQPAVWYEAHVETPEISMYGYHIAGFPLAQIGHTKHHAVGLTMFENDDIDYYRERINQDDKSQYWKNDAWHSIKEQNENIKVKGAEDVSITVRSTHHGPIMSDVVDEIDANDPVAMWWTYQKFPNRLLDASYQIMFGTSVEEVQKGAALIHAPGLNVMYGDVEGNIAWWACAKLPKRPAHLNSKLIHDGASGRTEIDSFYSFDKNPQSINPQSGFVYSANNQSVNVDGYRPEGYYLPEDRGRRIVALISAKDDWNVKDVQKMLLDITSENAPEIVAAILPILEAQTQEADDTKLVDKLSNWDGSFAKNSVVPTIYTKLIYHILSMMMEDELGEKWEIYNGTHVMKRSTQKLIANESSIWWDNLKTEKIESRSDIVASAFSLTIEELKNQLGEDPSFWKWGDVHTLEHPHAFDANPSLKSYFNVGPYQMDGTTDVINNMQFRLNGEGVYKTLAGPSSRRVIDLSNLENESWTILPTGQSGNVLSPHYNDQAEMYVNGEFRKQQMNKEQIIKSHIYKTTFEAAN